MTSSPNFTMLFYGSLVHSIDLNTLEYLVRALICVQDGVIVWIEKDVPSSSLVQEVAATHGVMIGGQEHVQVVELKDGEFLCPGFVDTHTHAPQYPNLGLGQQYQLLDWLENMTFPCEANFSDLDYARAVYEQVVVRNLNAGTTTCCYYGTVHLAGTQVLADVIHRQGQRALVGKCNMDRNAPANCCDTSVTQSMEDTVALIDYIRSLPSTSTITTGKISHSPLVQPCVTPRFAIACTDDLLSSLGQLCSSDPTLAIQTHISENKLEISTTLDLFPSSKTYADVYDSFGLLREGTILAHAVHLGKQELHLIAGKGAGISHCPTSNFNLKSGGAKIGEMLDAGIKVGLGSDCSGGYALGVLPQLRNASSLSKLTALEYESAPPPSSLTVLSSASSFTGKSLPLAVLFHMATLGGASLCRLSSITGNFLPGKEFDALLVQSGKSPNFFTADLGVPLEKRRKWDAEKLKETFERFLFVSDDRDIADVYVRGRKVGGSRR